MSTFPVLTVQYCAGEICRDTNTADPCKVQPERHRKVCSAMKIPVSYERRGKVRAGLWERKTFYVNDEIFAVRPNIW